MPPTQLITFTPEAVKLIEETVHKVLGRRLNIPLRSQSEPDAQTPDTYLAKPPVSGIPGITPVGTASGPDEGDSPGSAECAIYRILAGEIVPMGFNRTVYNFSMTPVLNEWFVTTRTKDGVWIAQTNFTAFRGIAAENVAKGNSGYVTRSYNGDYTSSDLVNFELGAILTGQIVYYMTIDGLLRAFAKEC